MSQQSSHQYCLMYLLQITLRCCERPSSYQVGERDSMHTAGALLDAVIILFTILLTFILLLIFIITYFVILYTGTFVPSVPLAA